MIGLIWAFIKPIIKQGRFYSLEEEFTCNKNDSYS